MNLEKIEDDMYGRDTIIKPKKVGPKRKPKPIDKPITDKFKVTRSEFPISTDRCVCGEIAWHHSFFLPKGCTGFYPTLGVRR